MNKLTKVVNIYPSMPITTINPPIRSVVKHVTKSIPEIRACLMARALVEEVLPDRVVRLDISNYDKVLDENNKTDSNEPIKYAELYHTNTSTSEEKSAWQIAYDNALEGKNLALMTRKQRRSAEAAARAIADAAVANPKPEVVMGIGSVETVEKVEEIAETVEMPAQEEPKVEVDVKEDEVQVEEPVAVEEKVETIDIEAVPEENE